MDFFDPQKQKRHAIRLGVGYALIALALALATTILLYQAYGFGIDRSGKVIQNGLVFLSSRPKGAAIYVNNKQYKSDTNTRMVLPGGQYTLRIERNGYRSWQRALTVEGGSVERFDYPLLLPAKLATTTTKQYSAAPTIATQSDDRRWLLVGLNNADTFDLFDLRPAKPDAPQTISLPDDVLSAGSTTGWQLAQWADDNRHVLLKRTYQKDAADPKTEYILIDREDPTQSKNLTQVLGFAPTDIELRKGDFNDYYAYDQANGTVFRATLKKPTPQLYLEHVVAFTSDQNTVLYASTDGTSDGKANIRLRQDDDPAYTLRTVPAGGIYLLDLALFNGVQYVAAGVQSEDKVFVYHDPLASLKDKEIQVATPVQSLKVASPNYVVFSQNARYVMAENNDRFAVYDSENDKSYAYQTKTPLDVSGGHADWMDGYHLQLISGGKVRIFDFDGANKQTLVPANTAYLPVYDTNYRSIYTFTTQNILTSTALLTAEDQ
ncbi:MAG TPA: PEGA domain-containing protein [Candidatus Saccharimonadales bacterium]|nr:PEGA domain-containing protein [Candidatus Saccharimonadales bacterium]